MVRILSFKGGSWQMSFLYLDYSQIALQIDALSEVLRKQNYDAIVIILRGGSFLGGHLSFQLDLPVFFLKYNRKDGKVSWVGEKPLYEKVILCEDFAGSGHTLIDCKEFLEIEGYSVSTFVVSVDRLSSSHPDYACFWLQNEQRRIIFPWERYRLNHDVNKRERLSDLEYKKTGWDMDGVFLDDIESSIYRQDIQKALEIRDILPMASYAPSPEIQDVIITGRPTTDYDRTRKWAEFNKITIPIYLRDDAIDFPTHQTTARWKAFKAMELGCTHYVESEADQAIFIAAQRPELHVIWWNKGEPIVIQSGYGGGSNIFYKKTTIE